MDNFVSSGEVLPFTAPGGGVVSGTPYLIDSILVIACQSAAAAASFEGQIVGAFDLPKEVSEAWTEGLKLYWDDSAKEITLSSGGNTLIGAAVQPIETAVVVLSHDSLEADLVTGTPPALTLQVLDYAQLATDDTVVTVTINGVAFTAIEGTDWTSETSDDVAATNLAAAIDAMDGVSASAATDTVTVVPATGVKASSGVIATVAALGRVRLDGVVR